MKQRLIFVCVSGLLCTIVPLQAATQSKPARSRVRTYYISADEVDWDFAPTHTNQINGEKYHFEDDLASQGTLDPNNTSYRKAIFREYTDATFHELKPRTEGWKHLGILGPLIRAEVGDTIKVIFRNNASHPYSIHPHGVFYLKDSEGASYQDNVPANAKVPGEVAPGTTVTYTWEVPERAGPTEHEGSTAFWVYHSHADEGRDINSGLIGPMIITRRGMARADGSPKDVDREFVELFGTFDEHQSWYWDENVKRIYGDPKKYDDTNPRVHDFHHFYSINGFLDGNGPLLSMHKGERIRWYLFSNPNEQEVWDVHTAHWHGQTAVVNHMRMDMVGLTPMMSTVADMVPDDLGIWLFHCHMPGHFTAGMRTRFQVLP
jgi:FtsP/CotA-like multicopper oxidase with cupredoxin domain